MSEKTFLQSLFDFSFSEFVTIRIIRVLFVIAVIGSALGGIAVFLGLAREGPAGAAVGLIVGPIVFFVYVLIARVWLELVVVVFRIAENTTTLVEQTKPSTEGPPAAD